MKSPEPDNRPYIAPVKKFGTDSKGNSMVTVRWYYWPEEASGGRKQFHGAKELFLSDHYDFQSTNTIEGKCIVHSFKEYTKLEVVGDEDYYSGFEYKARAKEFTHNYVSVYCNCEMPHNPDDMMMQCDKCKDWFHPGCVKITSAQGKRLSNYICDECSP
ncbi:Chromatin remodeling protein EBS [Heracleum sosnowskyi]|uniref:Chromatin remodeling protein EBS n=1 Tax=Heracleum sosnowskyi TaxID=360622 RepID=A0AAD8GS08_9APIA|nr:Chromatin remodeling protein EBS [Heracleum sosnowskyi]